MSKKVLKRSLALGALMAFVITGNVWAANITNDAQADEEINVNSMVVDVDGAITALEGDITISGNKDNTVLTVNGGYITAYDSYGNKSEDWHVGIGGDFRDSEGKSVTIENIKQLNVKGDYFAVSAGSDARSKDKPVGNVHIKDTVGETVLNDTPWGIFAGGTNAHVKIESPDISIDAVFTDSNPHTDNYGNPVVLGVGTNAGGEIILGTEVNKNDKLTIESDFRGIYGSGDSYIKVLSDNVVLKAKQEDGVRSNGGHLSFGSEDNALKNISIETGGNAVITAGSNGSIGIYGENVSIKTENGVAVYGYANAPITIVGEEKLDIKGNIRTDRTNAIVNINTGINDALVTIEGDIINNERGGSVDVTLGAEGSYLKGKITDTKEGVTLTMNEGTKWEVTDSSILKELAGNGGSLVLATIENDSRTKLAVASVDVGINSNANLTISGDAALTKAIEEGKVTAEKALDTLSTAVTSTDTESKTIKKVKTAEGKILGSYLRNEDGTADLQESSVSAAVSEAGMNLKAHWRAHMNDMNKRMGELRFANGETGVWTRIVRGESEYEGAKMQYNQYQLGYDEKLSVDKRWTVGAAVTFAEGDSSYGQGSSEDKSTAFAIYGSKLNNDGTFVDLIARYARIESDIEDSVYSKGEYDTNGMSVSAEFGKRIQQGNGLWIEPQVELTYGQVDSASVKFADGSVANYGDMDSLIGRVGFSIGKDIKQGNVYARASYLYDFDGETETTFTNGITSGKPVEDDFGGGWWEVGVGANINLSKATYIYADIEKTFGGEVDTNWKWNLGVRYSF